MSPKTVSQSMGRPSTLKQFSVPDASKPGDASIDLRLTLTHTAMFKTGKDGLTITSFGIEQLPLTA